MQRRGKEKTRREGTGREERKKERGVVGKGEGKEGGRREAGWE